MPLSWLNNPRRAAILQRLRRSRARAAPAPPPELSLVAGRLRFAGPIRVDSQASDAKVDELLGLTAQLWSRLGSQNPYWSVLTWDVFLEGCDEAVFFKTGLDDVAALQACFRRSGHDLGSVASAIELGCGVGRVTAPLAGVVGRVTALDISQPHLDLARRHLDDCGVDNVDLVRLADVGDIAGLPQAELFYSVISLQHNSPPVARRILELMLDRVAPGGFAYFQMPTFGRDYTFDLSAYRPDPAGAMEMHVLPQSVIFRLLTERGYDVLEVQEDTAAASETVLSHTFFARRRP